MKFSKDKCKVLHLEWSNPVQQNRLVLNWVESSFAEKYLGVLVLSINQQRSLAAKKVNFILGQISKCLPST